MGRRLYTSQQITKERMPISHTHLPCSPPASRPPSSQYLCLVSGIPLSDQMCARSFSRISCTSVTCPDGSLCYTTGEDYDERPKRYYETDISFSGGSISFISWVDTERSLLMSSKGDALRLRVDDLESTTWSEPLQDSPQVIGLYDFEFQLELAVTVSRG